MTYVELFKEQAVLLDIQASDSDGVIAALVDGLVASNADLAPHKEALKAALMLRESEGSTGSSGVGIPHVKSPHTDKVTVVLGVHQAGVDFNALDGEDVHVFFAVIRPEVDADAHIGLLRWLAGIAKHEDFVSFSRQASSGGQVIELLTELAPA
ncbi:MAG: PTS sugar transporter subunit IIA [Planctomycetota bacterium]|nr:PTS sugar transporter subunit IIA [Planctomycetota bacterium]MDA1112857.1 PTS sugar transporter subunit IIA [Planctomycetota bacterium]